MIHLFAWRYFKAKKSTNAINIIAWISILAIVIGTASLILVLSVFNGFEGLVKSLYSSFYPGIKITAMTGKEVVLTADQLARLRAVKGVRAVSLVAEEKALLQNKAFEEDSLDYQSIVSVKGVDDQYTAVSGVADHIVQGNFNTGTVDEPLLVLGVGIQNAVGVQTDRNIRPLANLFSPKRRGRSYRPAEVAFQRIRQYSGQLCDTAGLR
jgi:lipoprotein-releasing system permease protein